MDRQIDKSEPHCGTHPKAKAMGHLQSELQRREGIEDNSKIIFLISQQKHTL